MLISFRLTSYSTPVVLLQPFQLPRDSVSVSCMSFSLSALETKANARNRQAKAQPKSAAVTKNGAAGASTRGKGARGRGRGGRNPRPAKKTAEELDSEMADYWESGANAAGAETGATNGAAAANGDAAMDDEIL
jgi:hypothetical protein